MTNSVLKRMAGEAKSNDKTELIRQFIKYWTEKASLNLNSKSKSKILGDMKTFVGGLRFILSKVLEPPENFVTSQEQTQACLPLTNQLIQPATMPTTVSEKP